MNSMGYFNKTSKAIMKNKQDAISSYVREQLVYANEVQISTTKRINQMIGIGFLLTNIII